MTIANGTTYHNETPQAVINALEIARRNNSRIRLFYGDIQTGKSWGDEYETIGTIGRSTGTQKIPLLIKSARSMGGSGILAHCIVRITQDKRVIYSHPTFHTPGYSIGESTYIELPFGVFADGENTANFPTMEKAQRYIDFMTGTSNRH